MFCDLTDNKDVSVMMSEMDVNAIAGTLKLYFRELPEPLFTDELYANFTEGIGQLSFFFQIMMINSLYKTVHNNNLFLFFFFFQRCQTV